MGLFDTVIVEGLKLKTSKEVCKLLRDNNCEFPKEFQTKDLGSSMVTFFLTKEGYVYENVRKPTGKKVPYKIPSFDFVDKRSFLEKLYFKCRNKILFPDIASKDSLIEEIKTVKQKSKFTNTFNIYTLEEVGGRYLDLEYCVKVIEGKIKSIKPLNWSIESQKDAEKRHKNNIEFQKKLAEDISKRRKLHSKWYYPLIKETYNPFIFFLRLTVQKLCNKLVTWSYRWTGV